MAAVVNGILEIILNKYSILTLNVKKYLNLLRPQSVILNEAPDEDGKWKCSADQDVQIFI